VESGYAHDAPLEERMVNLHLARGLIPVAKTHCVCVVVSGVDAAHDALIISEEEDEQAGHSIDCNQQGALLVLVYHIVLWNFIHVGGGRMLVMGEYQICTWFPT
jgi:hypothetical protein